MESAAQLQVALADPGTPPPPSKIVTQPDVPLKMEGLSQEEEKMGTTEASNRGWLIKNMFLKG